MQSVRSLLVLFFVVVATNLFISIFIFSSGNQAFAQAKEKNDEVQASVSAVIEPVRSYETFWPLVAGKVMGEPFYFLKSLKESAREMMSFSSSKKADFNITLAEKRILEAEKLFLEKKDYQTGKKTLDIAQEKREKSLELLKKTESSGRNVDDLKNRYVNSLQKQQVLLSYIQTLVPENEKNSVQKNVDSLNSILVKYQ